MLLADAIGLFSEERYVLELSAWMHDVGKIGVPDSILTKPNFLTEDEFAIVKLHPVKGDGRGYSDGLKGEVIPLASRIIMISDAFKVMTADRSYRRGLGRDIALRELRGHSGIQFDPELVKVFIHMLAQAPEL